MASVDALDNREMNVTVAPEVTLSVVFPTLRAWTLASSAASLVV